ncbi:ABC transporter permease [Amycolatopsis sp. CA-230715]|uniref:ABC transporter permease n=1 Tax=Amycolatopsis sp. CA-230715 TaxID=2745196 RepID=UPI001C02C061|nr:ABC transporter permease [Amycolatopsis sp. CA-230715]QWF81713.1 Macrolide export ATP-binding/permease protein MacB [Amycolatopsis sp. CA-230715]
MKTLEAPPSPARLGGGDLFALGAHGMRTRPLRAVLSALGIAIGVAAMVAVLAVPASGAQALHDRLAAMGTNLLAAGPGQTMFGEDATLPDSAVPMAKRIAPVTGAAALGKTDATVRRTDKVAAAETSGLVVYAANPDLLGVLDGKARGGTFLNTANQAFPVAVLGSVAAARLGIDHVDPAHPRQVWIGNQWFTVGGILDPMPLAEEVERSVLVGWDAAKRYLGFNGHPTTVYVRAPESQVDSVRSVLAQTLAPAAPNEVDVRKPSEALEAQKASGSTYDALFLGLGAVALLVGAVGVANTMVISVLERRQEIGLRRALGATKRQIRGQFLAESVLLSGLGGACGVLIGVLGTTGYALSQGWPAILPPLALIGGVVISALVGALAGAYPAIRAARLAPTQALA